MGKIVLFLYPIPKSLTLPLVLYKKEGFAICIMLKITINKNILANNGLFFIKVGFIII